MWVVGREVLIFLWGYISVSEERVPPLPPRPKISSLIQINPDPLSLLSATLAVGGFCDTSDTHMQQAEDSYMPPVR